MGAIIPLPSQAGSMIGRADRTIPILDLSWEHDPSKRPHLLEELRATLFDVGFLYISNSGVPSSTVSRLADQLPALFALPAEEKAALGKLNSPHFLGYSGFAEETTLGKQDQREQFDFATELPAIYQSPRAWNCVENSRATEDRDYTRLFWRLRGPNQWPSVLSLPDFRSALTAYHDALAELSYRFVHLIEEAFDIPIGTFDHFFSRQAPSTLCSAKVKINVDQTGSSYLHPQHRLKLLRYPPSSSSQGVGAHKDSSGWLTFLYQHGTGPGLEVLSSEGKWLATPPIPGTFVVNFGNAFEAATEGAVKATVHRVVSPGLGEPVRYSVPFFMGLPLDMTISDITRTIPKAVRSLRKEADPRATTEVSSFLDSRWNCLGESQLRKWINSHRDVGEKWYGNEVVDFYTL